MEVYFGIDIGGTRIKMGVIINDKLVESKVIDVESKSNFEAIIRSIEIAIEEISTRLNISSKSDIAGIGISFPGIVDSNKRIVVDTNDKFDAAKGFNWNSWITKNYKCSFYIDNDAKLAAVGEWKYGNGKGTSDMVILTLGTGVGSGVILDNRLLKGYHGQAGNLGGHLTVKFDGETCSCGNKGCVEAQASTDVLNRLFEENPNNITSKLHQTDKIDFRAVFALATEGDKVAIDLRDYCMNVWGACVVNHIHAYDPELVVIGGGIMNSKDVILPYIKKYVETYAWTPWNDVKIVEASMLDNIAVFGAVYKCRANKMIKDE